MNFESEQFNSGFEDDVQNENTESNVEEIETDLSPEDFYKLEKLRNIIDNILLSNSETEERFEKAKTEFLKKLDDNLEEGELKKVAAVSFLKGEDFTEDSSQFDLGHPYSVMDFIDSFEK
jgi:hypothetical protein